MGAAPRACTEANSCLKTDLPRRSDNESILPHTKTETFLPILCFKITEVSVLLSVFLLESAVLPTGEELVFSFNSQKSLVLPRESKTV